ncbi:SusC/RagA family TonB-linked outer membrane protein [Chryseobacterium soli]|uniref:SusC/RagA family TonB-linked outer membrane protein n=1 Tax=Chryseobacterium soli TaxID=445961 RepID=UPI0029557030|nr:SusC/RagA family TonB-linked outer membrane protein [Chryseobacterium soli]MDV7697595.1 SusC/RagA family TonB-linked outer membrane protein [Chryseobacterium soli]
MKKLTAGVLILVLSSSLAVANAQQKKKDTIKTQDIEGVVVTALGIKREKKTIGYATSQVGGDDLKRSGESNIIQGLAGKAAGIQVTGSSGTPGASSKILIRGQKSINLSSQPIIVLDGQIIDNSVNNNAGQNSNLAGVDDSNRAIDINPDDIESVSILKGGAAAALYGENARNGVIIYTSKKGRKRKGIGIDFSTSTSFDMISRLPELQKTYAAGTNGKTYLAPAQYGSDGSIITNGTNQSWGPLISSVPGLQSYDNAKNFFETGMTNNYNLALSGGGDYGNFRASFGHIDQTGIIPNTSLKKTSFGVNSEFNLTDKLKAGADIKYSNTNGLRAQKGSNTAGVMLSLLRTPASYDLRDYETVQGYNKNYFGSYDNPYYTVNRNPYTDETNRSIVSGHVTYNYSKALNMLLRAGVDTYTTHAQQNYSFSSNGNSTADGTGQVVVDTYTQSQYNLDLLFSGLVNIIPDKITLNYNVGGQIISKFGNDQYTQGSTMLEPNQFNLSNFTTFLANNTDSKQIKRGVYASAELGFYDQFYLTLTGRNDWNSTLPKQSSSYFYPSVSGSWLFNKTLNLPSWVNMGKLRVAYATTFAAPDPYNIVRTYITPLYTDTFGPQLTSPYLGVGAYGLTTIDKNPNLKPERNKEFEIGLELELFKRLHLNASAYKSTNYDLLIQAPVAASSGYQNYFTNGPTVENKGLELEVGYDILKNQNFSWSVNVNWAKNVNKVVDIQDNMNFSSEGSDFFSGNVVPAIIKGQPLGVLYGTAWERDSAGSLIIGTNGLPLVSTESQIIGNPNPDWLGGIRNNFSYKNLSLSFLLDIRKGGDIWNGTLARLNRLGVSQASADNRSATYVIPGVTESGAPNTVVIDNKTYYTSFVGDGSGSANEQQVEKNINWVRLRDVSLSYNFGKLLSNTESLSFIKDAQVTFSARNLFLITNYKGVDPETSIAGAASNTNGFDYFNNPGTKSYTLSLKFTF